RPPRLRKATYVVPAGTGVQYDWKRAGFVRCWRWSCAGCQEAPPSKLTWMSEPRAAKRRRAPSLHHPLVPAQVGDLGIDPPQVVRRHAELDVRAGDTQLERVAAGGTGHEHALVAGGGVAAEVLLEEVAVDERLERRGAVEALDLDVDSVGR